MLSGNVERILQKGAYSREALLGEVRKIVAEHVRRGGHAGASAASDRWLGSDALLKRDGNGFYAKDLGRRR